MTRKVLSLIRNHFRAGRLVFSVCTGALLCGAAGILPVGEIVAAAPDVTTRKAGDRVGTAWIQSTCRRCEWCQRGRRMFCPYLKGTGIDVQGGHAEYMLMNADATYLIPR